MVADVDAAGGWDALAASDLGALEAEADARELDVGDLLVGIGGFGAEVGEVAGRPGEERVGLAFVDGDVWRRRGGEGLAGDVVGELGGDGLAGGVVVEALRGDAGEGDAGVDLEGLPGEDAFAGELGEDGGVAGGFEDFLRDLAGRPGAGRGRR